jgi:hydrogenase 3 maturation protease
MLNQKLSQRLTQILKNASQTVLLAVGSDLRSDDIAGQLVAENLKPNDKLQVLLGGTAPENLTGQIKRLKPSHLIIVDAAEMKEPVGTVQIIASANIGGHAFSTHALPLKVMIDFLLADCPCEVVVIAIQPRSVKFGGPVDPAVSRAAKAVAQLINAIL